MKTVAILSLLLFASSAYGELTKEDLRTIVKEENAALEKRVKEYMDLKIDALDQKLSARIDGVEKSLNTRIDAVHTRIDAVHTRIDALDGRIGKLEESLSSRIGDMWRVVLALIGFVAATIAIPQIIIARTEKRRQKDLEREHQDLQTEIEHLRGRLEALENTPS